MNVQLLTPAQWSRHRDRLIRLIKSWGSGRLTGAGLAALEALQPADLEPRQLAGSRSAPAAAIAVVTTEDGKTAGAAFAREAGLEACLVAVAPPLRGRGAGSLLLKALQERWGHLSCRVAADNTASMKMCFRAGSCGDIPAGRPHRQVDARVPKRCFAGCRSGSCRRSCSRSSVRGKARKPGFPAASKRNGRFAAGIAAYPTSGGNKPTAGRIKER